MLDVVIDKYSKAIVEKTQELIRIPSVLSDEDNFNYPFGNNIQKSLEYVLNLGKELGFKTKNIDNYCGYIEFGEGPELFGIIAHLDVVLANDEDWIYPPFSATIFDNMIYGRGAIDDKGPVIASIYAMKAVMDNYKLTKRVRLILGLDEENSWKSIEYYKAHEEHPTTSFSPDSDFPCIYSEKGVLSFSLQENIRNQVNKKEVKHIEILEIDDFSNPINVIPKACSVTIKTTNILENIFIDTLRDIILKYNFEISIYQTNTNIFQLTSFGKSSHSAHPELGINAISNLLFTLNILFKEFNQKNELLDFYTTFFEVDPIKNIFTNIFSTSNEQLTIAPTKVSLDVNHENMKENIKEKKEEKNIKMNNKAIKISFNSRIPIIFNNIDFKTQINLLLKNYPKIHYLEISYKAPIYLEKNNPLVLTLCDIYNKKTNSTKAPISIGGATYARAFNNCVSFGPNFPGDEDMCHKSNEYISIPNLILTAKIYAEAILRLNS